MDTNKTKSYYHDLNNNKHYFGGFLNLAENNIKTISELFCQRFELGNSSLKANINNQLSNKTSLSEYNMKIEFLKQYLPVIHYLDLEVSDEKFKNELNKESARREYFRDSFFLLIDAIKQLRSFYTHYYHSPISIDEKLFELLDSILLKVILAVKKHKMKDDKTRHILKKSLVNEFEKLFIEEKGYLGKKKKQGKRVDLSDAAIEKKF